MESWIGKVVEEKVSDSVERVLAKRGGEERGKKEKKKVKKVESSSGNSGSKNTEERGKKVERISRT